MSHCMLSSCGKCFYRVVSHNRGVWSSLNEPKFVSALFGLVWKLFTYMRTLNLMVVSLWCEYKRSIKWTKDRKWTKQEVNKIKGFHCIPQPIRWSPPKTKLTQPWEDNNWKNSLRTENTHKLSLAFHDKMTWDFKRQSQIPPILQKHNTGCHSCPGLSLSSNCVPQPSDSNCTSYSQR